LEIPSLKKYYEFVSQPEQHEERARMIDAITQTKLGSSRAKTIRVPGTNHFSAMASRGATGYSPEANTNLERGMLFR